MEFAGVIFLLIVFLYTNPYWVDSHKHTYPHFITLILDSIIRSNGRAIPGFACIISIFWFLILPLNLFGLLPLTFSVTSQMSLPLSCSIGLWGALVFGGILSAYKKGASHLVPIGVGSLTPFIIIVELIRSLVRPLTLAFRLAANITAGHVILGLTAAAASQVILTGGIWTLIIPTLYRAFEVIICWAQAYVFLLLCTFYSNDYINYWASLNRTFDLHSKSV